MKKLTIQELSNKYKKTRQNIYSLIKRHKIKSYIEIKLEPKKRKVYDELELKKHFIR